MHLDLKNNDIGILSSESKLDAKGENQIYFTKVLVLVKRV